MSWRNDILKHFVPKAFKLTVVVDPDCLLLEEQMLRSLRDLGFEVIVFDDAIKFRFVYESHFRSKWDQGEKTDLVVVLQSASADYENIPFDLLCCGNLIQTKLADIFENLSASVISELPKDRLDSLYEAYSTLRPQRLGEDSTSHFVLKHVFKIDSEQFHNLDDVIRMLLERHLLGHELPPVIGKFITKQLSQSEGAKHLRVAADKLFDSKNAFLDFVSTEWKVFIESIQQPELKNCSAQIRFDDKNTRALVDTYFLEGMLNPIGVADRTPFENHWAQCGILFDRTDAGKRRLLALFEEARKSIGSGELSPSCSFKHWCSFSKHWFEGLSIFHRLRPSEKANLQQDVLDLWSLVDCNFHDWVSESYFKLFNQSPTVPVMVHHIPRYMARNRLNSKDKCALIVLDGLSFDQWITIHDHLRDSLPELSFSVFPLFAWIPTLTKVSRHAIFAGDIPSSFYGQIKEDASWSNFWQDHDLQKNQVSFDINVKAESFEKVKEKALHPKTRVSGLIINAVDDILHGETLGSGGVHDGIERWIDEGFLREVISFFLDSGFSLYLTADHGNVEAVGIGRPKEGSIAETRGERVRIYPNEVLRRDSANRIGKSWEWPGHGLPNGMHALLSCGKDAFVTQGERLVTHGGASLEEVIVPFVRIERKNL